VALSADACSCFVAKENAGQSSRKRNCDRFIVNTL